MAYSAADTQIEENTIGRRFVTGVFLPVMVETETHDGIEREITVFVIET